MPRQIDYFLDPMCPYCWVTSTWIRGIRDRRDLDITWRFISLRMLNEDKYDDLPPGYGDGHQRGLEYLRVAAAVREAVGNEAVGRFYEALGTEIWETVPVVSDKDELRAHHVTPLDLRPILSDLGLDPALADARHDEGFDEVIRKDTRVALERAGEELGTPIISFDPPDGAAFFGPVLRQAPVGDGAAALWDAISTLAATPGFTELKTSKAQPPRTAFVDRMVELG